MSHLEGGTCWCNPVFFDACEECDAEETVVPCWKCSGAGMIRGEFAEDCVEMHFDVDNDPSGKSMTVSVRVMGGGFRGH